MRERGFTLVELITVIAILAVLAALALPRMIELSGAAHDSSVTGTSGALASAVQMANLACILSGWQGQDDLANFGEGNVDFNTDCYPTDTSNRNLIQGRNRRCQRIWNGLLEPAPSVQVGAGGGADYRAIGAGETCVFRYQRDSTVVREILYDATTGQVQTQGF